MLNNLTFHEVANIFPMMGDDEFAALKSDIAENGLREPIWTWNGQIIDGRNRYTACQELGIEPKSREWDGQGSPVSFVISLNLKRRHLNETQRATVAAKLANMTRGGDKPSKQDKNFDSANLQNRNITQPEAAKLLNVSARLVADAKHVIENAAPEVVKLVEDGKLTVNAAKKVVNADKQKQKKFAAKVSSGVKPQEAQRQIVSESYAEKSVEFASDKKYRVVYADPPWQYGNTSIDEFKEQRDHYKTMSIDEIAQMPIQEIVENDAVLFLWVTSPILEESFEIIKAWGFKYKASFVWDKVKHVMGHYNSVRHELLLVCVRGSCQPDVRKLFDSVYSEERTGHSTKPEYFRTVIDTIYPNGNRIELFARKASEGWDVYGNDLP